MEDLGPSQFDGIGIAVKKKRTRASRRPKPDTQSDAGSHDLCPLSTSPPSDDAGKASSDENADTNPRRKEINLNQLLNWAGSGAEGAKIRARNKEDEGFTGFYNTDHGRSAVLGKRSSEGVLAPANWKSSKNENIYVGRNGEIRGSERSGVILDTLGSDSQVRKVKLKVGGVTRTIETNSTFSMCQSSDTLRPDQKQTLQGDLEKNHLGSNKQSGLQGIPWKDFSGSGFTLGKDSSVVRVSGKNTSAKQGDRPGPARKSKRVAEKHALDMEFGEDYEDDEIRYLEKLRAPKMTTGGYKLEDSESRQKQRKLSSVGKVGTVKFIKEGKKSRSDRSSEDGDYEEEEELVSDAEPEGNKKKKQKESVDSLTDGRREMTLTTRQRALQSSKDGSSVSGASSIEFPNGLPPAPSRKQKDKLSEVEQQIKKAEVAERRRLQHERAARESEAEAIRKILGQDSSRKKREDKIKKRREELAQEKAANALLGSNTVRCVMGPTGTVVTFPKDMGLPSIFDSKPASYPPPREKCAGPSCSNPYRYRDSKSRLPLCSLQCYKAVQERTQAETSC